MKPWGCIQSIMENVEFASVRIGVESWKCVDLTSTQKLEADCKRLSSTPNMESHAAVMTNSAEASFLMPMSMKFWIAQS